MKRILPYIMIMETTAVEDRRQVEFEGSEEFPDLYDLGRLPLMEFGRLRKPSIPEIKVYRRKTETRSMRTRSFVKETLRQEISTVER